MEVATPIELLSARLNNRPLAIKLVGSLKKKYGENTTEQVVLGLLFYDDIANWDIPKLFAFSHKIAKKYMAPASSVKSTAAVPSYLEQLEAQFLEGKVTAEEYRQLATEHGKE